MICEVSSHHSHQLVPSLRSCSAACFMAWWSASRIFQAWWEAIIPFMTWTCFVTNDIVSMSQIRYAETNWVSTMSQSTRAVLRSSWIVDSGTFLCPGNLAIKSSRGMAYEKLPIGTAGNAIVVLIRIGIVFPERKCKPNLEETFEENF